MLHTLCLEQAQVHFQIKFQRGLETSKLTIRLPSLGG